MTGVDMITGILAAAVLAAYGKGYILFTESRGEEWVLYTMLCAVGFVLLVRRLISRR